jgi:HAD superfamily hydrolase (TIGR01509 family)
MPVDLVIFDCDGVLVDSEVISCRVHAEVLTQHGYPITAEQVSSRFMGRSALDAHGEVERELGRALPDGFEELRKQAVLDALATSLVPIPHIHAALDTIAVPVCVASSGFPSKIVQSLTNTRLHPRFAPNIFSASQVERGKPAPDLFLFAAGQMQVSPERCLVIEDSIPGITGALAAGMAVLGFHGGGHCGPGYADRLLAAGAILTFDDMRQLPGLIAQID